MSYKYVSAQKAVENIKSGDHIYIQAASGVPLQLVKALSERAAELKNVSIYHLHTEGDAPYAKEELRDSFTVNCFFVGGNVRKQVQQGIVNFIPVFLSEVPILIRRKIIPINVALVHVSLSDKHGYCSLGVSVEASKAAIEMASHVIAQVNPKMPRTHGDGIIHISQFDSVVEVDDDIPQLILPELSTVERQIGENVASLIEDGATLQMGIGTIPDAVLRCLGNHKNLGVHTEMFSDGVMDLVKKGIINGSLKKSHPGTLVTGFLIGTRKLYDFVDDNPSVRVLDIQYVNDASIIRKNPKVTSINSAIEVDYTGQVCADSIGTTIYSGVGGQMDFIRGASLSQGGKPIIALPSATKNNESRIVALLKPGAGVVTTRAHVHYVVTEYGVADLYGKTLKQRARLLVDLAHPSHREELDKMARERYGKFF